ncbi:hypothetical protein NFJ02_05g122840 [Pycnococcus provasolii]
MRRDGSGIACWGVNHGQAPPEGVDGDFVAIAAGAFHAMALRRNGNVACSGATTNTVRRLPTVSLDEFYT